MEQPTGGPDETRSLKPWNFCQTYGELAQNLWVHKDKVRQTLESYGIATIMANQTIGNP